MTAPGQSGVDEVASILQSLEEDEEPIPTWKTNIKKCRPILHGDRQKKGEAEWKIEARINLSDCPQWFDYHVSTLSSREISIGGAWVS